MPHRLLTSTLGATTGLLSASSVGQQRGRESKDERQRGRWGQEKERKATRWI